MANAEQVALLRQGSNVWNKWREENPNALIDFSNTDLANTDLRDADLTEASFNFSDLRSADLSNANLRNSDFSRASLSDVCLSGANLENADLENAQLSNADLNNACLISANLSGATLLGVNLVGADLGDARLSGVNLRKANLRKANLSGADLAYADLEDAELRGANLSGANAYRTYFRGANLSSSNLEYADLTRADLVGVDLFKAILCNTFLRKVNLLNGQLCGADLRNADLSEADLRDADFSRADLVDADLFEVQVLGTNFKQANLTGACITDWQIGSSTILEGVECDYIFRTYDAETKQFTGRLPVDPESTFAPGEFTQRFQIFASALETIDITFTEGIDWQAFFQSFQELRDSHPDEEISIQGMERKGDAFVVRLEVEAEADKGAIETEVKQLYAHQLAALEAQYEERLRLQGAQIDEAKQTIQIERREKATLMGIMATMAENQGPKYYMPNAQISGFADTVQGDLYGGVINNYEQDADDIVRLLTALRTWSKALPEAQQDDVLMELDALEADLNKPDKPEPKRLGKRLKRLMAAGTTAAAIASQAVTFSDNVNEFTENVLELGEKIGLTREDIQAQP